MDFSINTDFFLEEMDKSGNQVISIITNFEGEGNGEEVDFNSENIPILPLRGVVVFPTIPIPILVGKTNSKLLIKEVEKNKKPIAVFSQKNENDEDATFENLYHIGVVVEVARILEMPDHTYTVIIRGARRVELISLNTDGAYFSGKVSVLDEQFPERGDQEFMIIASSIKDRMFRILKSAGNQVMSKELMSTIQNINNPLYLVNFIASQIPVETSVKQELLEISSLKERALKLLRILSHEMQLLEIKSKIQEQTREELNQQQREYFLQQQIKTIQEELGDDSGSDDVNKLQEEASKKKWNKEVQKVFEKELQELEQLNPHSPDYSTQYTYLKTFVSLPWGKYSKDNQNLSTAQKVLDRDHYGMEKIKDRIIEHLAVLKLRGDMKSPILCLYGPPGVGKTSLGKSIATALKRKYVRISLGGVNDEAEIRGHRRTYIGAMPGRVIKSLQKAETSNPVFLLDEIDKIGNDYQGDPAAALLEVLDPEQNNAFHDNYLDVDYDLSKVLFIATANDLSSISRPLLDRMEIIELSGYVLEEKIEIAKRHLIPKQIEENGLKKKSVSFQKEALECLIKEYTHESGVRGLEKKISEVLRKIAKKQALEENNTEQSAEKVTEKDLKTYLGKPHYLSEKYEDNRYAGVVTGLAWTAAGGEILFIETSLSKATKGGGGKLSLTGNLGDVMKESALLALEYLKTHSSYLHIDDECFEKWNVHIHVPEGATPKDGPSAGITMVTSLASAFTQRKVKEYLAMTGEITLRGLVLPVGGIREKILAAKRAGIKEIILCKENERDIEEINQDFLAGLTFHYVKDIKEVIDIAVLEEKVEYPLDIDYVLSKKEAQNTL